MAWVLYGATGYTGALLAEEAVRRGHRPLLAGRSEQKLRALAQRLGLPHQTVSLDDPPALRAAVSGSQVVLNAAGPFSITVPPMIDACLETGVSYLDISGDISTLEYVYARDQAAKQRGIVLMPAAGFDVVPTDCLAREVADRLPDATHLELVIVTQGSPSAGSTKTLLDLLASGISVRVGGMLRREPPVRRSRYVKTPRGERLVVSMPWADVSSAYRSTGIPNIAAYVAMRGPAWRLKLRFAALRAASRWSALRGPLERAIERRVRPPAPEARTRRRAWVGASALAPDGRRAGGWLETIEAYEFTAASGVLAVEHLLRLSGSRSGAFTPSQLLGSQFALSVPGTRRIEVPAPDAPA
jgi:short subunit dehydrogenase-like uncharacterized protein